MGTDSFFILLFRVVVMLSLILLLYFALLFIGKKTQFLSNVRGMKVINQRSIGMNTQIIVIQVYQKVYIVIKSQKSIEKIDEMSINEWEESENRWKAEELHDESVILRDGKTVMDRMRKKWQEKKGDEH